MRTVQFGTMGAVALLFAAGPARAQETDTRGIVPEQFLKARPAATGAAQAIHELRNGTPGGQIGVTIWRLRRSTPADSGARILVQEEEHSIEWTPERVSSSARLAAGDRVRLTIESPARGYLYVVDRERYGSGEFGDPYLIFPTLRTRKGDNSVGPGKLIDIPGQEDRPNFFSLHASRADQSGEELTILVAPLPIDGLAIGRAAQVLSKEQFLGWQKRWGTGKVDVFELPTGPGQSWTKAEQEAAAGGTRLLTQEDPPPQTVYRAVVKPGEPLLVKVELNYRRAR